MNKKILALYPMKTGGTSFKCAIQKAKIDIEKPGHRTPNEIVNAGLLTEEEYISSYKIITVRCPYVRAVSQYFFIQKSAEYKNVENPLQGKTFEEYVKSQNGMIASVLGIVPKFMADYLIYNNSIYIDFIVKIENMKRDIVRIIKEIAPHTTLDEFPDFAIENKGEHKPYPAYYNRETQDIVYRANRVDFEIFNYPKEM